LILCYYVSSGILGDVELMLPDRTATSTVIALSPFRCVCVPFRQNAARLTQNIGFMNHVAAGLSQKLVVSSGSYAASALNTAEERLCAYILAAARDGLFTEVLSEVAQSVGMSYRHLFRVIGRLCGEGVLQRTDGGFRILDPTLLKAKS
ncbi:MAG: helix-turn-helix domain-containing protein, partial [Eubacteriales bacterium]|nr:helix-turn-helix domain-containing protein [Eubacteriales bacterium]